MKNKKMIVNYCQCWGESGTHYTQQIKIDVNTMLLFNKYLEKLKKEVEKDFNIKRVYTEEDLKKYDLEYLHETGEHQLAYAIESILDKMKEIKESKE